MAKRRRVVSRIEGGQELLRTLHKMGVDVEKVLEDAARIGAQEIVKRSNPRAPRPEIQSDVAKKEKGAVHVEVGPPEDLWYWRFLETGATQHEISGGPWVAFEGDSGTVITRRVSHTGMAADPFLRPAFDGGRDAARDAVGNRLKKEIVR